MFYGFKGNYNDVRSGFCRKFVTLNIFVGRQFNTIFRSAFGGGKVNRVDIPPQQNA
jgi:hypothetical protein